jgi:glycosyltransferase involved in cell wall biosynthesis
MKITVISSSVYPASPEQYGSECELAYLANELGKKHEVTLIAAVGSLKGNYKLLLLPNMHGKIFYEVESLVVNYWEKIKDSDFIIDGSALNFLCEEIYFWNRNWLKNHVIVYYRNGTSSLNPRPPVNFNIHGVWLSNTAIKNMQPFKIPKEFNHIVNYGIPDFYEPIKNPSKDYILYVGAPRKEKGIFRILNIAKRLPEEKFIFAWRAISEEHKKTQQEFLEKAKDIKNVVFYELPEENQLKEKIKLMQNAKAFIQVNEPNYVEAQGLARLEALRCGAPLIVEESEAAREFLNEDVAFFCKTDDDIVNAIKSIEKIDREKCSNFVKERYSVEKMANSFLNLYQELALL